MHSLRPLAFVVAATVPSLAACTQPAAYSEPVAIELKAKSSDAANGVVSEEKGITTESGNPYGAFVHAARAELGHDPATIELADASLLLGGKSTQVTALSEVFDGEVAVLFVVDDSHNSYPVAHTVIDASVPGGGPVALDLDLDPEAFAGVDRARLLGGNFKVVLRGPSAAGFSGKGAEAVLQTTFAFEAFD
ncbi:MAG: hypothetical protein HY908_07550 [Myxococcales bacterium]|nr:hypothetical protein [Myxococcales bacterium]